MKLIGMGYFWASIRSNQFKISRYLLTNINRQFLGLVTYFKKFIPNFAHLSSNLTKLLKKNYKWVWGDAQTETVNKLKSILISLLLCMQMLAEMELGELSCKKPKTEKNQSAIIVGKPQKVKKSITLSNWNCWPL